MALREVTGTLIKPDGTAMAGEVSFILEGGYTDDSVNVVLRKICRTTLNGSGVFSINLHSGTNVKYTCTLPTKEQFEFDLEEDVNPLDIVTVR